MLARDRTAVAPALNLADDQRGEERAAARALLATLETRVLFGGAARLGLTGAPGAGKSTLMDALVRALRARGETVGIVAVDPSSRKSGGALLGDRVRVRSAANDAGVFFRSLAARESLGGLSDAARAATTIMAAVFDRVIVETVGVGQSEGDVADLVDTLVFVAQPAAGDTVQFLKAGVLELPDVFAVNKADLGGLAERTARELESALALGEKPGGSWVPPVVLVSARDNTGIDALEAEIARHRAHLAESGALAAKRRRGRDAWLRAVLAHRYGSFGLAAFGGSAALGVRVAQAPDASGFALELALAAEIERALRGAGA
ncbi:MAG: methylmalonyl Co-A mutase-associated GTPase MeaB [Myxococcota bacterium]